MRKNRRIFRCLGPLLAALLLALGAGAASAATTPAADPGQVFLDFRDIPLTDLIRTMSELTGKNFLYDDRVRGNATIISPQAMTLEEAYQLFLAVLDVKGFAVVSVGRTHKIVPTKEAAEGSVARLARGPESTDQFVTRLVPLQYVEAEPLVRTVLSGLVPKTTRLVPYPALNRLIVSDSAGNVDQIVRIVAALDTPDNRQVTELVTLTNADAEAVAQICRDMLSTSSLAGAPRRSAQPGATATSEFDVARILAYKRTNTLVVKGDATQVALVKELALKLDGENKQARSLVNVYYLENADAESMAKTLKEIIDGLRTGTQQVQAMGTASTPALGPVSVTADKATNALIVGASTEDYETLRGIIQRLDGKRKQVFVEALILELSMDATEKLGASLQGGIQIHNDNAIFLSSNLNKGSVGVDDFAAVAGGTLPSVLGQAVSGILAGGLFNPITVPGPDGNPITVPALSALIELSKADTDVNILSAPRLLTSDNQEAEIVVGRNVPIITSRLTDTGGSTGLAQSVSVERKDVALVLRLTPQITEGDLVRLNVYQEITDVANTAVGDVNQVGPTFTKRLVRNTVIAENGRTVVLGGLISNNVQNTVSKVPLLGDIPVLGYLFKQESATEVKTNLLVFITPRIIKDSRELGDVSQKARESMKEFQQGRIRSFTEPGFQEELLEKPARPAGE